VIIRGRLDVIVWSSLIVCVPFFASRIPADLYAILKATETLEKAYARDAVGGDEYEKLCVKLISQFKSTVSALKIEPSEFCTMYTADCPRAVNR